MTPTRGAHFKTANTNSNYSPTTLINNGPNKSDKNKRNKDSVTRDSGKRKRTVVAMF